MSLVMASIGLKRLIERQLAKRKRTPLEYLVLATIGCFVAALIKYPNRAIMSNARPDLKAQKKIVPGLPLIGNLLNVLTHQDDLVIQLHKMFTELGVDVMSITLPVFGRAIIVNRAEFMEHIFKTNFDNYVKGEMIRWNMSDLLGRGIFVVDGDEWKFHRKTASNIFTTKLYRSLVNGAFKSSAEDFSTVLERAIAANRPVDLQEKFLKLTLDAFGKLTFGLEFKALLSDSTPNEFGDAFDYMAKAADARISNPLWFITDRIIPGRWKKHQGCLKILDDYAAQAVKKRRSETPEQKETRARDLLDHFINHKNDDGSMLTDRELRDVFVNFMIAGRDTTAQALTWQFYCLLAHPRVMENILYEIDTVLEDSIDKITYEVLMNELPYVKAVLHETLRLHPPVSKNFKQAADDDILPDGTRIYKGEFVAYSNWCMGRNKAVWGIDAEQYVPERWLVSDTPIGIPTMISVNPATGRKVSPFGKFKPESQFKFVTFNAGPRLCLGMTFAILEAMTTTCILLQRYCFKLAPGYPEPTIKGSLTLPMKQTLMVTVTKRVDDSANIKRHMDLSQRPIDTMAGTNLYIAHHNYDAEKSDELTLQVGDIISVSEQSDPGWWVGEIVKNGQAGWFPANFVDPYEEKPAEPAADPTPAAAVEDDSVAAPAAPEETAAPPPPKHEGPVLAKVEYDYEAKEPGELSLEAGRVVTILDSSDPAWWTGDLNGKVGTFPSNYVKLLENKTESEGADKPAKFKLAAFGVKQGGLGSLFAGGVVPGLKKTGGLKKFGAVPAESSSPASEPIGGAPKRTSVDEPRSPVVAAAPPKISPPLAEDVAVSPVQHHTPARATPPAPAPVPAPAAPPVPTEEPIVAQEPRVPSRARKPKVKQNKAVVIYDYAAQEDDEITLVKGSTIIIVDKMGDEGWWCGRNEEGVTGNFPSDFVEEIKETIESPVVAPAVTVPTPVPVAQEEALKSPTLSHPPVHAPVPFPSIPTEPLRVEPVRSRTNETPLATPPPPPRGSRPPSMISSPTPTSAQLHDIRASFDGPPLPSSPPPKRMSTISRTSSYDVPVSPRISTPPVHPEVPSPTSAHSPSSDLSRSSTMRRHQKPIPEAPLPETEETVEAPVATESPEPSTHSNRNSYILPTPVARNRPLPPLARPPSIHSVTENRKSMLGSPVSHLPPVPSEPEQMEEKIVEEEPEMDREPEAPIPEKEEQEEEVEAVEHKEEPEEPKEEPKEESIEEPKETEQQEEEPVAAAAVEEVTEEEPVKPKLPEFESTGPALSHVSRPRPARGRKLPTAPVPAETSSFVAQLEAEVKAAPAEEVKPTPAPAPTPVVEKAAPPPKPVKPIFHKFPTPFAGAQPAAVSLRPTGRRTDSGNEVSQSPASSASSVGGSPANAPTPAGGAAPPVGGVKSLSSRFGQFQGVPAAGGNTAALELEIAKLRRWMTEELDRVKKELSDERESREKLQQEVNQLRAQLQG
ncbi:hypothetical protein FBU30_001153 [Linnemannia zychae]|nr:hypothetical protein FBU30_001153 [Linnemannia zychae]